MGKDSGRAIDNIIAGLNALNPSLDENPAAKSEDYTMNLENPSFSCDH